jgi:hypothetical protein
MSLIEHSLERNQTWLAVFLELNGGFSAATITGE